MEVLTLMQCMTTLHDTAKSFGQHVTSVMRHLPKIHQASTQNFIQFLMEMATPHNELNGQMDNYRQQYTQQEVASSWSTPPTAPSSPHQPPPPPPPPT
ncbi:hypothetical protein GDO78_013999, partial [Eleutherodactylus coqui]